MPRRERRHRPAPSAMPPQPSAAATTTCAPALPPRPTTATGGAAAFRAPRSARLSTPATSSARARRTRTAILPAPTLPPRMAHRASSPTAAAPRARTASAPRPLNATVASACATEPASHQANAAPMQTAGWQAGKASKPALRPRTAIHAAGRPPAPLATGCADRVALRRMRAARAPTARAA